MPSTSPVLEPLRASAPALLEREILLEVHGERASPAEVESTSLLALAAAYLSLLSKTVEHEEERPLLQFTGLRVHDKCVAVGVVASDEGLAERTATRVAPWIEGVAEPPKQLRVPVQQTRDARRALNARQEARLIIAGARIEISVADEEPPAEWQSMTKLRARVLRTGGREPKVRFEARGEAPFSLSATADLAIRLGRHLYKEVEIVALVTRDRAERIIDGTVEQFEPVEEMSAEAVLSAWRAFHVDAMGRTPLKGDGEAQHD